MILTSLFSSVFLVCLFLLDDIVLRASCSDFANVISSTLLSSCSIFFRFNETLKSFYSQSILNRQPGETGDALSASAFAADGMAVSPSTSSSSTLAVSGSSVTLPTSLASALGLNATGSGTASVSLTLFASALAACYPDVRQAVNMSQGHNITGLHVFRLDVDLNGDAFHNLTVEFLIPLGSVFDFVFFLFCVCSFSICENLLSNFSRPSFCIHDSLSFSIYDSCSFSFFQDRCSLSVSDCSVSLFEHFGQPVDFSGLQRLHRHHVGNIGTRYSLRLHSCFRSG